MALPAFMYRDPADIVESNERRELGCTICRHSAVTMMRAFCAHDRNIDQKGYPWKGYRCRLFESNEHAHQEAQ